MPAIPGVWLGAWRSATGPAAGAGVSVPCTAHFAAHTETKVIDSRLAGEGRQIRQPPRVPGLARSASPRSKPRSCCCRRSSRPIGSREPFDEQETAQPECRRRSRSVPVSSRSDRGLRSRKHLPQAAQHGRAGNRGARHRRDWSWRNCGTWMRSAMFDLRRCTAASKIIEAFRIEIDQLRRHRRRREPRTQQRPIAAVAARYRRGRQCGRCR